MGKELTVSYLKDVLSYCDNNALMYLAIKVGEETQFFPVSSLIIQQDVNGNEMISFGCQENVGEM